MAEIEGHTTVDAVLVFRLGGCTGKRPLTGCYKREKCSGHLCAGMCGASGSSSFRLFICLTLSGCMIKVCVCWGKYSSRMH